MKKTWPAIILTGMIVILFFSGFSLKIKGKKKETKKEGARILGIWQSKGASKEISKITFLPNGSFEEDLNGDGAKDIGGEYAASASRVTLINKEGAIGPDCRSAGVYRYTVSRKELRLTKLSDQCPSRGKAFETAWKR
ncbi:MAG TPA: hypothetical protein VJC08_01690 [bacterium]|nr:hypothetical protein [bacterium]